MKVKVIARSENAHTREIAADLTRYHKNADPELHPFERAHELKRSLNAVKLDRVFAKPFVGQLDGHLDTVSAIARSPTSLPIIMTGACDGEVRVWHLGGRRCLWKTRAHESFVTGIAVANTGGAFFTASLDRHVHMWRIGSFGDVEQSTKPFVSYEGANTFSGIDYHHTRELFATASRQIDIWDPARGEPMHSFAWGEETIHSVRFNPVEPDVLASTGADRAVTLYDIRTQSATRRVVLQNQSMALSFNPMEAFTFTVANDDGNLYSFDMRKLDSATHVHMGHVGAVIDVDWSPTGQEFASGSYDRTVRIFNLGEGRARDVYHTKRMQRVMAVRFSLDAQYVVSGSDDTALRLWKAQASDQRGILRHRAKEAQDYRKKLMERFANVPAVRRIARHRHLPKAVYSAQRLKHIMSMAASRKEKNRREHNQNPEGFVPERRKHIVAVQE